MTLGRFDCACQCDICVDSASSWTHSIFGTLESGPTFSTSFQSLLNDYWYKVEFDSVAETLTVTEYDDDPEGSGVATGASIDYVYGGDPLPYSTVCENRFVRTNPTNPFFETTEGLRPAFPCAVCLTPVE